MAAMVWGKEDRGIAYQIVMILKNTYPGLVIGVAAKNDWPGRASIDYHVGGIIDIAAVVG